MSDATTEALLPEGEAIAPIQEQSEVTIRFDDQAMATNYANVASVASTADEILLLFEYQLSSFILRSTSYII